MKGDLRIVVSLEWKWNHSVCCSIPKHIPNFMKNLRHLSPVKLQHSPYPVPQIKHGMKVQAPLPEDESLLLPS